MVLTCSLLFFVYLVRRSLSRVDAIAVLEQWQVGAQEERGDGVLGQCQPHRLPLSPPELFVDDPTRACLELELELESGIQWRRKQWRENAADVSRGCCEEVRTYHFSFRVPLCHVSSFCHFVFLIPPQTNVRADYEPENESTLTFTTPQRKSRTLCRQKRNLFAQNFFSVSSLEVGAFARGMRGKRRRV